MKYLGIDIGGTSVKLGLVTDKGKILASDNYEVAFDNYKTPIFETVKKSIERFLKDNSINKNELMGIGVSATGQVNSNTGVIVGVGGNIKNWCNTEIKKELEEIYNLKTTVINDANSMVIGEQWIGKAKNYKNIIGITIGTGVGGGIIVNSNVLLGNIGIAGELGHFSINSNGKVCTCGNIGCYEQYASMTALIKNVKEKYSDIGNLSISKDEINGKYIFDELEKGNKELEYVVINWIEDIGKGLVSLAHIFNPEIIIIGGAVSKQEKLFIKPVRNYVLSHVMQKFGENLKVEAAELENSAGLVGAVHYNINN
ncbi:ROK family protein [Clostridium tertium]|jgi:glucokinase|uniref:ROK family protein n=1 Tax=Clostridium tertium TaxID=1559 RepID=A0A9X3XLP8_9CLOT|nr:MULTISPECIES: ROK family protein [Clostridium]EEH98444.1 ROK family protein (putative glucokinase) [Clostridium sp. 7_2_43FAA]MBU6137153.1 ROK family protein [Clostridium tertium]MDB1935293.1 ROK family protein [Clostridium tertium]MDB1936333.1 ROK family protein [Clostridium tertium]MDB1940053.1 ROK family protein [Clostridium tertium]